MLNGYFCLSMRQFGDKNVWVYLCFSPMYIVLTKRKIFSWQRDETIFYIVYYELKSFLFWGIPVQWGRWLHQCFVFMSTKRANINCNFIQYYRFKKAITIYSQYYYFYVLNILLFIYEIYGTKICKTAKGDHHILTYTIVTY